MQVRFQFGWTEWIESVQPIINAILSVGIFCQVNFILSSPTKLQCAFEFPISKVTKMEVNLCCLVWKLLKNKVLCMWLELSFYTYRYHIFRIGILNIYFTLLIISFLYLLLQTILCFTYAFDIFNILFIFLVLSPYARIYPCIRFILNLSTIWRKK